jgi:hypothetical protein
MKLSEIYESKPNDNILYSAVVLDDESRAKLLEKFPIPNGFRIFAHHMTIVFGKGLPEDLKGDLGKEVTLTVKSLGVSDKAIAVSVDGYLSSNEIPHITLAVNTSEGGKPYDSNRIEDWKGVKDFTINGVVTEVSPK